MPTFPNPFRRHIVIASAAAALLPAGIPRPTRAATPACGRQTPSQMEGPFFTPNSPRRNNIVDRGVMGTSLVLTGRVLDRACKPIANALLDFWQCDARGDYDNKGFRLRGHQFTDANGFYRLETIVPGTYPGRTPHIHVKVQRSGGRILTTQLYLEDHPGNDRDFLFDHRLIMERGANGLSFDFILTA